MARVGVVAAAAPRLSGRLAGWLAARLLQARAPPARLRPTWLLGRPSPTARRLCHLERPAMNSSWAAKGAPGPWAAGGSPSPAASATASLAPSAAAVSVPGGRPFWASGLNQGLSVFVALALGATMLGLGCTVEASQLGAQLRRPLGLLLALLCQFGLMPLVAFLLALVFALDEVAAVAVLLCGCCPGGNLSNIMALLVDGDMNLRYPRPQPGGERRADARRAQPRCAAPPPPAPPRCRQKFDRRGGAARRKTQPWHCSRQRRGGGGERGEAPAMKTEPPGSTCCDKNAGAAAALEKLTLCFLPAFTVPFFGGNEGGPL